MRQILRSPLFAAAIMIVTIASTTQIASARRESFSSRNRLPDKIPAKSATKRTFIDFSKNETASANSTTTVRSRKILAAPEGDSAEPMSSMAIATPTPAAIASPKIVAKTSIEIVPKATPDMNVEKVETAMAELTPPPTPVRPPIPFEPFAEFPETARAPRGVMPPRPPQPDPQPGPQPGPQAEETPIVAVNVPAPESAASSAGESRATAETTQSRHELGDGFFRSMAAKSLVLIRSGVLNANTKKFDDRMKNSATSLGLAVARGIETAWGEFELRAAFDVYHPMDQSVTIDNIRMFNARTEAAYWFSHSRVKPGLSLGLGLADYSIRSYRSINSVNASNEDLVTLKTHAKGRAFSIIPATSLRIELAKELVIDGQAEFMALLGGDSSDAAQGLGVTVSLGWMF